MAMTIVVAAATALVLYLSAPWWGAEVTPVHRRTAALVTLAGSAALGVLDPVKVMWAAPLLAILSSVAVIDQVHQIIPNRWVALLFVWGVLERWSTGHWIPALLVAVVIFAFYLMVHVVTHGGMGMGDVKFAGVLAFALGYPAGLVSMVAGIWAAGLYAVVLLVRKKNVRTQKMPLGPFLALGGLVGFLDLLH